MRHAAHPRSHISLGGADPGLAIVVLLTGPMYAVLAITGFKPEGFWSALGASVALAAVVSLVLLVALAVAFGPPIPSDGRPHHARRR